MATSTEAAASPSTRFGSRLAGPIPALVLVQILFGVHYYAARIVLGTIPPLAWATLRIAAAALLLLPLSVALRGTRALPRGGDLARLAGLSVLGVIINQICFVEGLSRTTLSHSALINCSIPVLTMLLAVVARQERAAPLKLVSLAVALAGVLLLLRVDNMVWDTVTQGDLLTLANATSFSLFLVLSRPVLARQDALVATGVLFAFGAAGVLPLGAAAVARLEPGAIPVAVWGWGLYIIFGATVVAYWLNYHALRRVESSTVALFIYLQPILAAAIDIGVLGTPWSLRLLLSGALIFGGVYLAVLGGRRRPVTPLPRGG